MGLLTPNSFGLALDKLKLAVREGLVHPDHGTLSFQARKLLERIITLTPAHGSEPAKAQFIAMRNDVLGLVQVMPVVVMNAIEARFPEGNRRLDGWLHDSKRGVHVRLEAAGYIRSTAELRSIHKRRYTYRGRVRKLPPGSRYYISPFVLAEYLGQVMNPMAGKAKAGWLPAATALYAAKIPRYAFRHSPGQGVFIDGRQAARPFIEVRNRTRWARNDTEAQRIVDNAIRFRTRDMETHFARTMTGAVRKAGLAS